MSAQLYVGSEIFDIPEAQSVPELKAALQTAFSEHQAVTIDVERFGNPLTLIINSAVVAFVAIDEAGKGMGFHAG
jgi:hypothetical protein